MALKNMSLLAGATITASGGSAQAFTDDGLQIPNGVHLIVPADTDFVTRRQATAKYRAPAYDAKALAWSKDKKSISYTKPIILASGAISFCVLRIERECHPEMAAADAVEMNKIGAQLLTDPDLDNYWANGSLS